MLWPLQDRFVSVFHHCSFLQVLNVVADYHDRPVVLFTVVMTTKAASLYKEVFRIIVEKCRTLRPAYLMADFKLALRKLLKESFRRSRVLGCR